MSETKELKTAERGEMKARGEPEAVLRPPVDIYEDATGITLHADLPGVARERLNINVDNDTLIIDGQAVIEMPEGMEALYADVRATHYRRSFTLNPGLETDKIEARLDDGVLTLRVPKHPELRPRKIEVKVA